MTAATDAEAARSTAEAPPATPRWPADRPVPARRASVALVAGLAVAMGLHLFARSPERVERLYAIGWSPAISRALGAAAGLVPVSVGEILVVAAVAAALALAARALVAVARGRRRLLNALACGGAAGAAAASVLVALFLALWGLNYARPDLATRLELTRYDGAVEDEVAELARLTAAALERTNATYELATGGKDLGRPSAPAASAAELDAGLERAYARIGARLPLGPQFGLDRGRAKPVLGSVALSYAGIAGMYMPFTGEANYNRDVPACMLPEVIGHEKAHQRGIASEDEANFFGFLSCVASDDPYARYSGWLFALNQLGWELRKSAPDAAGPLLARRDPGVLRDLEARDAFWRQYQGIVEAASRKVNDTFIRANGDRRGIAAYGFSTRLIVLYARAHGGELADLR